MIRKTHVTGLLGLAALALFAAPAMAAECKATVESNDAMQFTTKALTVPASCKQFVVTLKHVGKLPAKVMGHNFVLGKTADIAGIAAEACARWPLSGCTVVHRVGRLRPGEPIVLVLTASPHRAAALESCAFLIDWLKTGAPFWKREEFADGRERWVEAKAEDDRAAARWARAAERAPAA